MKNDVFFDTNILVYLGSADPKRAALSFDLVRSGGVISVQVLNEYVSVVRGKYRLPWDKVRMGLEGAKAVCKVVPLSVETHDRGIVLAERYQLGVYDAMIVAAAQLAGCTILYTEDMQDGQVIDGLKIRNPYHLA